MPTFASGSIRNTPLLHSILNKAIATISEQTRLDILEKWTRIASGQDVTVDLTAEERKWLRQNPRLKFSVSRDQVPYFIDGSEGTQAGIIPEMFDLIGRTIGRDIQLVGTSAFHDLAKVEGFYGSAATLQTSRTRATSTCSRIRI